MFDLPLGCQKCLCCFKSSKVEDGGQIYVDLKLSDVPYTQAHLQAQLNHTCEASSAVISHAILGKERAIEFINRACSIPQKGCFLGVEIKKKLESQGKRQAEAEFHLFSKHSPFPFVQLITDMETGGMAFYKPLDSSAGTLISIPFLAAVLPGQNSLDIVVPSSSSHRTISDEKSNDA